MPPTQRHGEDMVRKILPALLIALALTSCAEAKKEEAEIDRGEDVVISEIPFSDIKYNDSKVGLNSVVLYQNMDETYHYYHPWVIVRFDRYRNAAGSCRLGA